MVIVHVVSGTCSWHVWELYKKAMENIRHGDILARNIVKDIKLFNQYTVFLHDTDMVMDSLLPRALPLRGRPGHVASGFWNLGEPFRPPAREGLGPYFLARSRSPLRPSPAHRHAWERRVITSNILFSQCCLPVSSLSCLFTHINMVWLYKISLFYQSLEGQSKAADSCKN